LLTAAAETMSQLFYPFQWPHVYIPVLSRWLLDFIQAPTPFIMGVPTDLLSSLPEVCEVIMVDLDKGTITSDIPLVCSATPTLGSGVVIGTLPLTHVAQ
jgi:DENN domain-containing protein 1